MTDAEMLEALRRLLDRKGALSGILIDETGDCPSSGAFQRRFGSLTRAYQLVGYTPERDYAYIEINRALWRLHPTVISEVIDGLERFGGRVSRDASSELLIVNEEFSVSAVIARCRETTGGRLRWRVRMERSLLPDVTIAVRMDGSNIAARDYLILPTLYMDEHVLRLQEHNGISLDAYSDPEIAKKTGLSLEYVRGVARLLAQGEQRLLRAVEVGHIPVSVAVQIADADDVGIQEALHQAYEKNLLRGRKLLIAKRIVESRRRRGRGMRAAVEKGAKLSSRSLVRAYREDTDRKRLLIRRADATRNRLIFIAHAMRELLGDEKFVALLKSEKLDSLPKKLVIRMERGDVA